MKTRLQRFLADCGVASRRECEEMILAGRVRVNGDVRTKMPVMIEPETDTVTVDDERVGSAGGEGTPNIGETLRQQDKVYFLLNKPKGILVTNHDPSNRKTVSELMIGVKERVFPVGRLDMDSRGALIMTNDGELANRLTHPRFGIEKTYIVEVDGRLEHGGLEKLRRGIWLGTPQHPSAPSPKFSGVAPQRVGGGGSHASKTERFHIKIVGRERGRTILEVRISEAKNREIRRVMARIGHTVRDLNRVAIAGKITTRGLDVGKHRPLTPAEIKWLLHASSPEYHQSQKASTQAWYEAKEMEKERKRLEREAKETVKPAPAAPAAVERVEKQFRPRPVRKGRKPFVPPSGRNAGKILGGDFRGRKRLAAEADLMDESPSIEKSSPTGDLPRHPLGDSATPED